MDKIGKHSKMRFTTPVEKQTRYLKLKAFTTTMKQMRMIAAIEILLLPSRRKRVGLGKYLIFCLKYFVAAVAVFVMRLVTNVDVAIVKRLVTNVDVAVVNVIVVVDVIVVVVVVIVIVEIQRPARPYILRHSGKIEEYYHIVDNIYILSNKCLEQTYKLLLSLSHIYIASNNTTNVNHSD